MVLYLLPRDSRTSLSRLPTPRPVCPAPTLGAPQGRQEPGQCCLSNPAGCKLSCVGRGRLGPGSSLPPCLPAQGPSNVIILGLSQGGPKEQRRGIPHLTWLFLARPVEALTLCLHSALRRTQKWQHRLGCEGSGALPHGRERTQGTCNLLSAPSSPGSRL